MNPDIRSDPDNHVVHIQKRHHKKKVLESWAKGAGAPLDQVVRHPIYICKFPTGDGRHFDVAFTETRWSYGDKSITVVFMPNSVTPLTAPPGSRERRAATVAPADENLYFERIIDRAVSSSPGKESYAGLELDGNLASAIALPGQPDAHESHEVADFHDPVDENYVWTPGFTAARMIVETLLAAMTYLQERHFSFVWPIWRDTMSGCAPLSQADEVAFDAFRSFQATADRLRIGLPLCVHIVTTISRATRSRVSQQDRSALPPLINVLNPIFARTKDHRFVLWMIYGRIFERKQWVEIYGPMQKDPKAAQRFKECLSEATLACEQLAAAMSHSSIG